MGPGALSGAGHAFSPAASFLPSRGAQEYHAAPSARRSQSISPAGFTSPAGSPAPATYARPSPLAAAGVQELEFSFAQEVRSEELIRFSQRTAQVADGLQGPARESYLEVSRAVAARFEMSLSISGEALGNFAAVTEDANGTPEVLRRILDVARQFLERAGEAFQEFFAAMGGGTGWSFTDLFERMQRQWDPAAFMASLNALAGQVPGNGRAAAGVQLEFRFAFRFEMNATIEVQTSDPVMLDLDGDGFELTHYSNGAHFDILGNGAKQRVAFVTGGDAFLALDRNGNGIIDSGLELFGDQRGAANGYEELRKLDVNGDNVIDSRDPLYARLTLWRDNGNGITEPGELISLAEAGIAEISLGYSHANEITMNGNRMAQLASFKWSNGNTGRAGDAVLNYTA
jgi:hypothetical protein